MILDGTEISETALLRRINRKLKPFGRMLCKSRGLGQRQSRGEYYLIDFERNIHLMSYVDLEALYCQVVDLLGER